MVCLPSLSDMYFLLFFFCYSFICIFCFFLFSFYFFFFFFFSSRRRHTRYWRDWSSDVCSSDLCCVSRRCYGNQNTDGSRSMRHHFEPLRRIGAAARRMLEEEAAARWRVPVTRSEERRVGKECRSRWSPDE